MGHIVYMYICACRDCTKTILLHHVYVVDVFITMFHPAQEQEIYQKCIRGPPNRTIWPSATECGKLSQPHRSSSASGFTSLSTSSSEVDSVTRCNSVSSRYVFVYNCLFSFPLFLSFSLHFFTTILQSIIFHHRFIHFCNDIVTEA